MNSSRKLAASLASGAFLLLAVTLSAEKPSGAASPSSGGKSGANDRSPSSATNPPAAPNRPAYDPKVQPTPSDPKPGTGLTPSPINSGSGPGSREGMLPDPSATKDPFAPRPQPQAPRSNLNTPPQFNTMDVDRDGRISATEFTAPSAGWLRSGASDAGTVSGAPGSRGPLDRPNPATMPRSSGGAPNSTAAENHAKLFQQLDTDKDGYLSPTELETYRAPTPADR